MTQGYPISDTHSSQALSPHTRPQPSMCPADAQARCVRKYKSTCTCAHSPQTAHPAHRPWDRSLRATPPPARPWASSRRRSVSSSAVTRTGGGGRVSSPDSGVSGALAWRSVKPAPRHVSTPPAPVPGSPTHLELPVGRLQKLLRLIGRTARRQHELVDHDLVFELVHVHGHGAAAQPAPASLRVSLTRPPLASRPRLIQIFTVRSDSPRLAARRPAKHAGMCSPRRPRRMDRGGAWTPSPERISVGRAAPAPG